ncbi:putative glycoside hydrolase [Undibacterium sp. TS12]|uniref:putative glycoside hydrolase n=1 Tax=Undibacterium sp. TS12 TaxID=2908202 RepID=UPI001F4D21EF|nr:putative glycoside hydrolase [Undibacterium sp. TS12]MCH8622473.1 GTP-binding protein [Undibacterium sp. TS12]
MTIHRRFLPHLLILIALNLPAAAALALDGVVLDATSKQPLAGALVTVDGKVVVTDKNGRYSFPGFVGTVAARAIGYGRSELKVAANTAEAPPLRLTPIRPKALYLSIFGIGDHQLREAALDILDGTEINALVIDVKGDRGWIPYPSKVSTADSIGARRTTTVRDMPAMLATLKERGIYLIARIVVFKDDPLATAHPEWAVKTAQGSLFRDREGLAWIDASHTAAWTYALDIAAEAAGLGFDEIQFDYIRFPDSADARFSAADTEQKRVEAITGFLAAAKKRLAPYNVFVAADIFGYVAWNTNDTAIGQQLESLLEEADYLSPMLYPSGFHLGIPGYTNAVKHPYEIVNLTLQHAVSRSGVSPLRFRPWLQAFRDYAFDHKDFTGVEIKQQIDAAEKIGSDGWMLWNPRNNYSKEGLKKNDEPGKQ